MRGQSSIKYIPQQGISLCLKLFIYKINYCKRNEQFFSDFPAMGNNQMQPQTGSSGTSMTGSVSSASGGSTNTGSSSSGGSASFHGTNLWRCDSHVVDTCDPQCLDVDPKDGCPFCVPGCRKL